MLLIDLYSPWRCLQGGSTSSQARFIEALVIVNNHFSALYQEQVVATWRAHQAMTTYRYVQTCYVYKHYVITM